MDILGYLTLLALFAVPLVAGFSTILLLKGALRFWMMVMELAIPALWIAFYVSPLSLSLRLRPEPGYNGEAILIAVLYVLALGFLVLSAVGMGIGALVLRARRLEVRLNNIP